jgi:hypothetical protein
MKTCGKCKIQMESSKFVKFPRNKDGYASWCKGCHNSYNRDWARKNREKKNFSGIKNRFKFLGLTRELYNSLIAAQGNKCKICNKSAEEEGRALAVDHCHLTNKIRGLLCQLCNRMLGMAYDNEVILESAIQYLKDAKNGQKS